MEIHQHGAQCPIYHDERLRANTGDSLVAKNVEAEQPELTICVGVPGQVLAVSEDIHQLAQTETCSIKRDMNIVLACEGDPVDLPGQRVLVHVGFVMSIIDEDETKATSDALRQVDYDITSA